MLSSEFVIIDNPLPEGYTVTGVYLLNYNLFIFGKDKWMRFDMRGNIEEEYDAPSDLADWSILNIEYDNNEEYRIIFWTGNLDDDRMILRLHTKNGDYDYLEYHSAIVLAKDRNTLYTCTTPGLCVITKYTKSEGNRKWERIQDLPRAANDDKELMLQIKLNKDDSYLFGTTSNGFVIWDLNDEKIDEEAISLTLPYGTRNITTRMLQSNSIILSAHKNYAIAGVRKNLYVWSIQIRKLVKVLDAHFGRIIQLEALTIGNWNSIVTSSIDRTAKVWNINNIFETVHVIDRHELQVDAISLSDNLSLAVTATRNCVGVWDLRIGKLVAKLADSPLGAIVTHAIVTPDGKYIISAETGNILIWLRMTQQVIFKDEQPGIKQLTLIDGGTRILSVSKPSNPPGTDFVRTTATVCLRGVPSGEMVYTFEYPLRSITGVPFKPAVVTSDNLHLVLVAADKTNHRDCVLVYNAQTGCFVHRIPLKSSTIKDILGLVAMPHKGHLVAVLATDKGAIIDIRTKKHIRTVPKWGGCITKDGKHGLYAPSRGGLELIELKKGQTVRTFIPKVAEGVFSIICLFNKTDEYVLYYHSGKKTLRVFRTSDAEMIANYRVQAELTAVESTPDGKALVLGTVDGCVSVLAIVDTQKSDMNKYLSEMPSRDEGWKKKVEKTRAQTRFKAVGSIVKLSTMFSNETNIEHSDM